MAEAAEDWSWVDDDARWIPPTVDTSQPSIARVYDYWLGGKDNYPADREIGDRILQVAPEARDVGRANRAFLVDAVRSMAAAGIRQFIDLGAGIPTSPSLHEIAWAVEPEARIVYVDNDPIVLAHNRALMQGEPRVLVLARDIRQPASVMDDPKLRDLLDLSQPVGVLMIAILHFVEIATAPIIVGRYLQDLARGSQLAISVASSHGADPDAVARTTSAYSAASLVFRTEVEVQALFDRLDMVRPVAALHQFTGGSALGGIGVKV